MSNLLEFKRYVKSIGPENNICFYLAAYEHLPFASINRFPALLIELDAEDIKYFKDKYLPKVQDEFNEKLTQLKNQYEIKTP